MRINFVKHFKVFILLSFLSFLFCVQVYAGSNIRDSELKTSADSSHIVHASKKSVGKSASNDIVSPDRMNRKSDKKINNIDVNTIGSFSVTTTNTIKGNVKAKGNSHISIGNTSIGGQTPGNNNLNEVGSDIVSDSVDNIDNRVADNDDYSNKRMQEALTYALLCKYIEDPLPDSLRKDWEKIHPIRCGDGLQATLFHKKKTNKYVLAFEGSKTSFAEFIESCKDWVRNDIPQAIGLKAPQYSHAIYYARSLKDQYPDAEFTYTGNSLGGGLAAVASLATGDRAITFNRAGIHPNTLKRNALSKELREGQITDYYVKGEALHHMFASCDNDNIGISIPLSPPENLKRAWISMFQKHYLTGMIQTLQDYVDKQRRYK